MSRRLIAVGLLLLAILATQNLARMQNVLLPTTSLSISNIAVTPGAHSVIISWDTDADSNSTVEFDTELFVDVNSWPVDFYSNWSGNQGENGVNYEFTNDNAAFLPMIYRPLLRRWQDPSSAQTHFRKINTPTTKKIEFEPGHEGGTQYPFPSLSWTVPELADYWILGSAECDQNTCDLGDGITVRVYANGSQVNATNVSAGNSPEINTSLGRLPPGTQIRITVDSRQNSNYDAGNLSNLRIHGYSNAYRNASADASLSTHHEITLPGLAPETTYHYRVKSCDANGCTQSGDNTFNTQSELSILGDYVLTSVTQASVQWETNIASNSSVQYSVTVPVNTVAADFYHDWSDTQGFHNIFYEYLDLYAFGNLTYTASYPPFGNPAWMYSQGPQAHFEKTPEEGVIWFHPGTGGSTYWPYPILKWVADSPGEYRITGNVTCGVFDYFRCDSGNGITIRVSVNDIEKATQFVGGSPVDTRVLNISLPDILPGDYIRIRVDPNGDAYYDWSKFTNLRIERNSVQTTLTQTNSQLVGYHEITLTGLSSNTTYNYNISSCTWEYCVSRDGLQFTTQRLATGGSPMMLPLLKSRVMQQE